MLKYNDSNVQRQKELTKQYSAKNKKGLYLYNFSEIISFPSISGEFFTKSLNLFYCAVPASKPKKPDTLTVSKDSDSRASTPSKEVTPVEKTTPASNTSTSSSRGRAPKSSTASSAASIPNQEQNTTRELKRGAPERAERDSRDEGPKYVHHLFLSIMSFSSISLILNRNKKRTTDPTIETEESFTTKTEVKIKIPEELKPWLVDDWDAINRQHKLLDIPAKNTVKDIIDTYIQHKKSNKSKDQNKEAAVIDVMYGLVSYFNVMLGSQLLYKSERPQYADILREHPDKPMAELYGSFHLLRLFVRIGSVLSYTSLGEKDINTLMQHVQDFLKWLVKHITVYFSMQNFVNVTPEYSRKAQ